MKSLLIALSVAVAGVSLLATPIDVDAKRLGGGRAAGMQRQAPAQPPAAAPAQSANPGAQAGQSAAVPAAAAAPAAAGAAAAAGKRSWMGPLAGLAAGIGLAALFSHLGMGEGLANFVMIALLALVAVVAVRWVMGRMAGNRSRGPRLAGAGAGAGSLSGGSVPWSNPSATAPQPMTRDSLAPVVSPAASSAAMGASAGPVAVAPAVLPGGIDQADFVRLAKMVFIRLQAANDAGNVDDLRKFTTPELFASLRLDLQDRGAAKQQTDVVTLEAEVADVAQQDGQDIVSVRFHGLIREATDAGAEPFNELWHLVRPASGDGDWAIAGITPIP